MIGERIGYVRVSTYDQNPDRQLEGVEVSRKFVDHASGKDVDRPQFQAMMQFVRDGDTVLVHSMDRLARNLDDLRSIVQGLTKRGVVVEFIKENLCFKGDDSPIATLTLSILGAFAEFERRLMRERQREGIALAKKRGAYKGRKPSLAKSDIPEIMKRLGEGVSKSQVARDLGVSRETLYKYLRPLINK